MRLYETIIPVFSRCARMPEPDGPWPRPCGQVGSERGKFLHEVDKPGSDIEEYTTNLDKLLVNEIKKITELRTRLNKFRIMLKDEEILANIFDDEIILSPEDSKKNLNEQSQDQDSLNIDDLGNEGIPNKPKFKFEKK